MDKHSRLLCLSKCSIHYENLTLYSNESRCKNGALTMSGYQFGHIEGYARQGGVKTDSITKTKSRVSSMWDIAEEAERSAGATPHIENPQPPILHFGVMPSVVMKEAAEWAEQAKDAVGRKLRVDGLCLAAGVISFPNERKEDWPEYRDAAINYLKKRYGDRLKSVIEHTDEEHPHIHFYLVPKVGERFDSVHDGYRAANEAKAAGAKKGEQNTAYRTAMKEWQDSLYQSFGLPFGLARLGPKRRRLTRKEWRIEQAATELLAKNIKPEAVSLSQQEFVSILNQQKPEHFAGVLGRGEPLYTAEQLRQAALDVAKTIRDRQLNTNINTFEIASKTVESAQANRTEELAGLQTEIAELKQKITEYETALNKLQASFDTRGTAISNAAHKVKQLEGQLDNVLTLSVEWKTKYQQEHLRANGFARDLSATEDELRKLKRERGIGSDLKPF